MHEERQVPAVGTDGGERASDARLEDHVEEERQQGDARDAVEDDPALTQRGYLRASVRGAAERHAGPLPGSHADRPEGDRRQVQPSQTW